ncbi:S8 family peptidase [Flavobacterium sp.]|uniref:S8 family peptidase n=1 Tax=Flavobacterium sp. TaxID=239 RepID=UPI0038FC4D0B
MNNFKITLISAVAIFALAGCGASKKVYDISAMAVKAPFGITKKTPLKEDELKRWSHLDIQKDTVPGMSVDKAYAELLKDKTGVKVIVGVVDSGVDIEHEDLKSVIWTNENEIANNGIDDDKNGYIDDVHGWNFLGDAVNENLEMTRIQKKGDDGSEIYKNSKLAYDEKLKESESSKNQVDFIFKALNEVSNYLKKENFTLDEVQAITTTEPSLLRSKKVMTNIIGQVGPDFRDNLNDYKDHVDEQVKYHLNLAFNGRKVIGDDPNDFKDKKYGNNNVTGPDKEMAHHGTHVAGIIAQSRKNNLGGDGVANNVEIMAVRAVPNGDEYDKDVALAIRYAVDNGAKVINTSFGKYFSPNKQWVYDAIKYAAKKDVLIVHSAGNESKDNDKEINFPNDHDGKDKEFGDNVLTIGALNFELGDKIAAGFSNYGTKNVDVYAPGVKIYATTPNNSYKFLEGTSMASPNVAGVAALIRSYYPKLSASQVKHILMDSGVAISTTLMVGEEGKESRTFASLSKSGKIVNAYNALLLADKMTKK